ncbi:MAG: response regulator [Leptothrix sp. (in: b-proteobacteria)]
MPLRALIIEDNAVARTFLTRVVRESFSDELVFDEAADVETARELLGLGQTALQPADVGYSLILSDLEQPDGAGLALLAEISAYPAVKIATTLHSDDEHLFPALQCGASGYLLKEDRFEVLVEELQKIVRGQPPLAPSMARRLLGFFREHPATGPQAPALAAREAEVLGLLSKGYSIKEIGRSMGIRWFAVNDHIRAVYAKLAQASSPEAALRESRQALDD